jgi:serine/threonine protein kinase
MVERAGIRSAQPTSISAVRPRDMLPGVVLGERYRVSDKLAEGGMGCVYLAVDLHDDSPVAVKLLRAEVASHPQIRQRFLNEARATMSVRHEHVVEIRSIGELPDGSAYYVMELIEGLALDECGIELDPAAIVGVALQICAGLAAAHDKGVVHRDLKPENVIVGVDEDGSLHATLIDFGIAKLPFADPLTMPGQVMGTPMYVAPEQARAGAVVDQRSDIYALGVVLYELVSGRLPFPIEDPIRLVIAHQFDAPPPLADVAPSCPPALARVVMRCLQKSPLDRYATIHELAADLSAVRSLDDESDPAPDSATPEIRSAVLFEDPGLDYAKTVLFNRASSPISVFDLVGVTSTIPPAPISDPPTPQPWSPSLPPPPESLKRGQPVWIIPVMLLVLVSLVVALTFVLLSR